MEEPTAPSNPTSETPKNTYHIGGVPVEFPYIPYGSQRAFMARVISTLDRAQRDGHCHALLESPTGTGKSLSLLCSALAWQRHRGAKAPVSQQQSRPDPRASDDPLNHGGGFMLDSQLSEPSTPDGAPPATNGKLQKKAVPTILYASRTHSQLSQVIREYRKTAYRVPMAVLASRKHYCTNASVCKGDNLDEECKLLLENKEAGCPQFNNVHRIKSHPSIQKGGCHEAHDIEDLVKIGKSVTGCSYYAARSLADDANIIFCPYSYIINPVIRRAMEIDIKGAILILDEAHNIEDMSREAASVDIDEDTLHKLQMELGQLRGGDPMVYEPLYEMVQDVLSWMDRRRGGLEKRSIQHYFSCWSGGKALKELQEANISQQCFPILRDCAVKAIKFASDTGSGLPHLSGMSAITLEGLFSSLSYFFQGDGLHVNDYQLVVQSLMKKDTGSWVLTFSLWCMNPAVVFRDVANLSLSVILTSGTLSPMNSFSSELGIPFSTLLEAPHVIDVKSQVWTSIISTGPDNYPLNASYKTADGHDFQDSVGKTLEELFKVVPGGSLVFFPSYKLMEKLCERWKKTGRWSDLNARKPVFVEPRGGSQEDFDAVLKGYYSAIQGKKSVPKKKRKSKKINSHDYTTANSTGDCQEGAAFLAVCRGKVSEGIDFSDENARLVIIIGIPFPNINDIQVAEKKKYNDTYKHSKNLLSGSDWYCHQAFRALNQAAGRCIRHRHDYGAIIFLDERFREDRNTVYISKWLRKTIRTYENFETSVEGLRSFFCDIKEKVGNSCKLQDPITDISPENFVERAMKWKNQKVTQSQFGEERSVSGSMVMPSIGLSHCLSRKLYGSSGYLTVKSQSNQGTQESLLVNDEYVDNQKETNADCHSGEDLRCCETPRATNFEEWPEFSVVQETPMAGNKSMASPEASMADNSHSTIIQASIDHDQANHMSLTYSAQSPSKVTCAEVTPERIGRECNAGYIQEIESSANLSVNSHVQKKRMSLKSQQMNSIQMMKFDSATAENTQDLKMMDYSVLNDSSHQRTKYHSSVNFTASEFTPIVQPSVATKGDSFSMCAGLSLDEQFQIFCSLCGNPLGLSENNFYVPCLSKYLSKNILIGLSKGNWQQGLQTSPSPVLVLIVDISSIDQRLYNRNDQKISGQGIWCQEDGCVYNSIFCPFCISPNQCLGVQIMAADASNIHFISKILFFKDRLAFKTYLGSESKESGISNKSCTGKITDINSITKYAYQPQQQHSPGGWRTTKAKSRPLKRSPMSQV